MQGDLQSIDINKLNQSVEGGGCLERVKSGGQALNVMTATANLIPIFFLFLPEQCMRVEHMT